MALVEGVVFDLGNVLIDWDPYAAIAAGVGSVEARKFLDSPDFDFMAWNNGPDSGGTWDDAEAEVARTHPHWVEHARSYRANFAASLLGEVAGSIDIVRELYAGGVPMFGLTNWSHELYPHAPRRFEFLSLFEDVVVSGTEGVSKPSAAIYEIVAIRSGITLDRLVFVDDREANVEAAAALGMAAILFTDAVSLRRHLRDRGLPVSGMPKS